MPPPPDEIRARTARRLLGALLAVALVIAVGIAIAQLFRGAEADVCAQKLVDLAVKKDRAGIEALVKSPSAREELLAGASVELAFTRPSTTEWIRVGVAIKRTETATAAKLLVLALGAAQLPECSFLREVEVQGAFAPVRD